MGSQLKAGAVLCVVAFAPNPFVDIASLLAGRWGLSPIVSIGALITGRIARVGLIVWLFHQEPIRGSFGVEPLKAIIGGQVNPFYLAAGILTIMFLVLLAMDIGFRFIMSGRLEPFFNSLATFALDFTGILMLSFVVLNIVFKVGAPLPALAVLLQFALIGTTVVAVAARVQLRRQSDAHFEGVLARELSDPRRHELLSSLAREMLDVEVFAARPVSTAAMTCWALAQCRRVDAMSTLSGNGERRTLFIRILRELQLIEQSSELSADDLLLSADTQRPYRWISMASALMTTMIFLFMVYVLATSLRIHTSALGAN